MPRSKSEIAQQSVSKTGKMPPVRVDKNSYSFDCMLIQPLGYTTYRPLDGRSVDQELLDSVKALGLKSGDRVTITVTRTKV